MHINFRYIFAYIHMRKCACASRMSLYVKMLKKRLQDALYMDFRLPIKKTFG